MEHAPIIDRETINMLREMDAITEDALLLELIDDFLEHSVGIVAEIRANAEEHNYAKLATHAHSLKGASLNIGVLALFQICDQIESQARALVSAGERFSDSGGTVNTDTARTIAKDVADLEPAYQSTTLALHRLRERTSRGEAIDDLLCS